MEEKDDSEKFDIKDIYTPLSVAEKEIRRRWEDKDLRKKVEDFLGGDVPEFLKDGPRAVLARHVASPNLECFHFIELANLAKIKPLGLEYSEDKYLSCNPAKFYLGKLCFFNKYDTNGNGKISCEYIIDFPSSENRPLKNIKTLWGKNLIDFHHEILKSSGLEMDILDISKWYKRRGGKAKLYMKYYLALFICNGILFENYLTQKNEKKFTENVIIPAFSEVENFFGLKPLIVPIMPISEKDEIYWWSYPENIRNMKKSIKNKEQ